MFPVVNGFPVLIAVPPVAVENQLKLIPGEGTTVIVAVPREQTGVMEAIAGAKGKALTVAVTAILAEEQSVFRFRTAA